MSNRLKTYFVKTFGCQANQADSEKIAGFLEAAGFRPAKKIDEANWVIINTCSVRQTAEDRVAGLVENIRKSKIVVTGCMLYHPIADLKKKLPDVDYFVKTNEWPEFFKGRCKVEPRREDGIHAWVPIMEGCNNFCAYCVVPYARGREKSRPFEEIIGEVEKLAKQGYGEITLLGQNVNSYGKDIENLNLKMKNEKLQSKIQNLRNKFASHFALLLAVLNEIPGLRKISFLTSNPWDLTDDIIQSIKLPKIDKYLHLPVQSGDDEILGRMNRPYTAVQYIKLIEKVRKEIPQIKIGTDIIVGFPGETEKQFKKTVELCKKVGFEKAYIAKYSPRPGTAAFKFDNDIPYQEKKRRWKILEELINKKNLVVDF